MDGIWWMCLCGWREGMVCFLYCFVGEYVVDASLDLMFYCLLLGLAPLGFPRWSSLSRPSSGSIVWPVLFVIAAIFPPCFSFLISSRGWLERVGMMYASPILSEHCIDWLLKWITQMFESVRGTFGLKFLHQLGKYHNGSVGQLWSHGLS
jgi:hypothetical protein